MTESRFEFIAALLVKNLRNELTEHEKSAWERWLAEAPENRAFAERLEDPEQVMHDLKLYYESKENIFQKISSQIPELNQPAGGQVHVIQPRFRLNRLMKYAAAVLLVGFTAGIIWMKYKPAQPNVAAIPVQNIIQPGSNRVTLTLGNGSKIMLDSSHNGIVATDNGSSISVKDNQLSYQTGDITGAISYNTMTTPRGGQYKLLLPDGSAVWLNAQSSITYPIRFAGKERKVAITGEVYFEVAKDANHPFVVEISANTLIEVLGTHFNINAYPDERKISTTLVEGSVKIRHENQQQILKPNQQALCVPQTPVRIVSLQMSEVNEVMAWKNGAFYFEEADINTIMRQLARWYDFDVHFEGDVKEKFHLDMQRNTRVENAFSILEATRGVHFRIEGKKVTVKP